MGKTSKKRTKTTRKKFDLHFYFYVLLGTLAIALLSLAVPLKLNENHHEEKTEIETNYTMSEEQLPAFIDGDQGEVIEMDNIPTMEEVDGGQFMDKDTGISTTEGTYSDLGWSETYDVSSPEAFKNDTLNRCIYANNYYGAQCVSLARVFWWSYADRDVSTCGTGMAKGMMECAYENAGDDFLVYWSDEKDKIQAGDWLVFTGGQYGHVGMALGSVVNGYVALLGENQGGRYCEGGGAATNIININIKNLIGFYRPIAYIKPEPIPEPEPELKDLTYTYVKGDCFSRVLVKLGLDENHLWGEDGTVFYYTKQLIEQNVLDARGNVLIGVPFTLTKR